MTDPARLTLRSLPLPAKLVLSAFLIAVGGGYFSALVQIHMQHSGRAGEAMPTTDDVIERFSGLKRHDGRAPKSAIEVLISGSREGKCDNKSNMTPAFFASSTSFEKHLKKRGNDTVMAEREGERLAMIAWINAAPDARKRAFEDDKFPLPESFPASQPITEDYFDKDARAVAINTLFTDRCLKCHAGDKPPELDTYAKLEPYVTAPPMEVIDGKWVRSSRQMSVEGLTQSTHAHLLSFAVLFTLTGLIFSFTSYPGFLRGTLGPAVLVIQVFDVGCWWLARLDGVGPTFALAIIGSGALVGIGLFFQIVLSLFNMYGAKGKLVLALLFAVVAAGGWVLWQRSIAPALAAERASLAKAAEAGEKKE